MTTLAPLTMTCPACQSTFDSLMVTSTNSFGPRTTDFYQMAGGIQPLSYFVHTCPTCGFSGDEDAYQNGALAPEVVLLIDQRLAPHAEEARRNPARRYEFAALIAEWRGAQPLEIGWLYLKAAWCSQPDNAAESAPEAQNYREQTIANFEAALARDQVPPAEKITYLYQIGEQYRRIGRPDQAAAWFDRVVATASDSPRDRRFADLAVQQRDQPKEWLNQ